MGLQDRDYMHDRPGRGGRPFTPPSTGWTSWLLPVVTFALAGILVLTVVQRLLPVLRANKPTPAAHPAPIAESTSRSSATRAATDPFPNDPQWSTARQVLTAAPQDRTMYRCIINGVNTWSDQPNCPQAITVVLDAPQAAPTWTPGHASPAPTPMPEPPAPVKVQASPPQHKDKTVQCAALAEGIKHIDIAARQPLAAVTQDDLSQRKRDLQKEGFFLHCNL